MTETTKLEKWIVLTLGVGFFISLAMHASGQAVPSGASIILNSTEAQPTSSPGSRADDGGTITVVNLDTTQQNAGWKAYVGNVSGRLTLDDANSNTIYDWAIAAAGIQGEVYVSRNNSVAWAGVECANETIIVNEDTFYGKVSSTDVDSINNTFNYTSHSPMTVGAVNIGANTCRTAATYVNDTQQPVNNQSSFQEILLQDGNANVVYAMLINQDQISYKGNSTTYDFQLIVAENSTASSGSTYYFYLEIGS